MLLALDVLLTLEAIVLWALVEQIAPGIGWTTLAVAAGIEYAMSIPTRPMTRDERDEWLNG